VMITGYRNERPGLSYKKALRTKKVEEFVKNYDEEGEPVILEGKVIGKNKGGFIVESDEGIEVFLPKSQAYLKDTKSTIGKKVKLQVLR